MGRRTVATVIPAKKVIGKTKDKTENQEDYWTDSEPPGDNSKNTTPVLVESPRFRNKHLRRGTGVKALSRKQITLLDDETEEYDYCTQFESVTDSAYRTRPSGLTDASNRTRPSGLTDASNRTRASGLTDASNRTHSSGFIDAVCRKRSSSLMQNSVTFRESSYSDEPEKRVHDKSFNTSKTVEDNLTSPSHRSRNATYESCHPTISLTRKTFPKKSILIASRSVRKIRKFSKECVSKVASDNMVQEKVASDNMVQEKIVSNRLGGTNQSNRISKNLDTSVSSFSKTALVDYSSSEEEFDIVTEKKLVPVSTGRQSIADNYRQISKNQSQEIINSTSLQRSPGKTKLAKDLESDTDYKFNGNDSDKVSLIIEKTKVASSVSQHSSAKKFLKNNKLNTSYSSKTKRKINVVVNTENNLEYLEQEFEAHNLDTEINTPSIKEPNCRVNFSCNVLRNKDKSLQRSLRRKSRLIENDADNEFHSNASPEVLLARNQTYGAAVNTHQYFPSKKPSKYKKLHSLTIQTKIHQSENTDRDPENFEEVSEERNLEPPREKRPKKKHRNAMVEVPSDQLQRSKIDGNAVVEVPSDQLRRSKRNRIAPLKYWANERRLFTHNFITGETICLGIDPGTGEDDECQRYLKRMDEKRQQAKIEKKKPRKRVSKTAVFNKRTGKIEHVVLHMPFDSTTWKPPFGIADNANAGYYLSKDFNSSKSMFGFLKIRSREIKPSQISPVGNIYFLVSRGQVKVTIRDAVYEFKRMDSFIVPKHQSYSIENLLKSYALLSFCAFKAPFFDYELK